MSDAGPDFNVIQLRPLQWPFGLGMLLFFVLFFYSYKKVSRKVQGVPQSQAAANP